MIEDEDPPAPAGSTTAPPADGTPGGSADPDAGTQASSSTGRPMNPADFQRYIGRGLRAVFDDVAQQPVPDRFLELMKKLG